jgi:hypothetical protein
MPKTIGMTKAIFNDLNRKYNVFMTILARLTRICKYTWICYPNILRCAKSIAMTLKYAQSIMIHVWGAAAKLVMMMNFAATNVWKSIFKNMRLMQRNYILTDMTNLLAKVIPYPLSCKVIQVLKKISAPHCVRAVFFPKTLQDRETELIFANKLITSVKDIK